MRSNFRQIWNTERLNNKKLTFYNTIKMSFGYEQYLNLNLSHAESKKLAQFRSSSHNFNIETGRHGTHKRNQIVSRICKACSTEDRDVLEHFAEMPFFDPIIEDEVHVLRTCSLYEDYRHRLSQRAKTCLFANLEGLFTDTSLIRETVRFLVRANNRRFPKKEVAKKDTMNASCKVPATPQQHSPVNT